MSKVQNTNASAAAVAALKALIEGGKADQALAMLTGGAPAAQSGPVETVKLIESDRYKRADGSPSVYVELSYGKSGKGRESFSVAKLGAVLRNVERLQAAYAKLCELEGVDPATGTAPDKASAAAASAASATANGKREIGF